MEWLHDNMSMSTVIVFGVGLWLWAFVILAPWFSYRCYVIRPLAFGLLLTLISAFAPSTDHSGDFIRTRLGLPHYLATYNRLEKSVSIESGLSVHWHYSAGNLFFWTGLASMILAIRVRKQGKKGLVKPTVGVTEPPEQAW